MTKDQVAEKNKDKIIIEKPATTLMPPPPPKLERTSSIIIEPKTLLEDELNAAREEALKIINTHTKEEALKFFLTGLVPVAGSNVNVKQATEDVASVSDWDDEYDDEECSA